MKRNSLRLLWTLGLLAVVLCLPNAAHAENWVIIAYVDENGVPEQVFFYFDALSTRAARSGVAATGTPDAEPIQLGTPDGDPIGMGSPDADPIAMGTPDGDPIVMGTPDTTPIVMGTPDSTPIVMGTPDGTPIVMGTPDNDPIVMGTGTPDTTPIRTGASPSRSTAARRTRGDQ